MGRSRGRTHFMLPEAQEKCFAFANPAFAMRLPPLLSGLGLRLGAATALAGAAMDQEQDAWPSSRLYSEAWTAALCNLLVLGPFVFQRTTRLLRPRRGVVRLAADALGLTAVHACLYTLAHRCLHRVRACLAANRFHHQLEARR